MADKKEQQKNKTPGKQDDALSKLILGRQGKLESEKIAFNDRMQEVADYVAPHREDMLGTLQKGAKKGSKIYDGTAQGAAVLAADGIHGYHISPAFPWFKYIMNRKDVNKIPEVREFLDEIEFNMYTALTRSNFYSEAWMFVFDGLTIGTPPMFAEEDMVSERIIFESVHPGEIYIQENQFGEIDLLHRKRKMTARQLVQKFGNDNVPMDVQNAAKNQPFQEFEIIHAVFPREEYDSRMKDAENKRFASVWLIKSGNTIAKVSGFDQFPYFVWRYMRSGKEPYAITPAMLAMADIRGLNLMNKTILGAAQLSIDPAYNVPDYLEGKVQLRPRGLNYVRKGEDKISPVNTGEKYPIAIDREQSKQRAIKERFHVDTFLMLASLEGRGQRTAYEVSELMAEKAAVLGAELGPLNNEIDHILDRVYDIETAAGRMPPLPDILYELAANDKSLRFDPVYMGPLAQAQRERFSKEGIRKFFVEIAPLVQVQAATGGPPEILDNFDLDEASRILADSNNVPAAIIRSETVRDQIRKARAVAAQKAQQAAGMQQGADVVKTLTEADKNTGGKMSEGLTQVMGGQPGAGV